MNVKFKKILSFGVVLASVGLILTACSGKKSGQSANKDTKHGIALITDENGVDDHSFNQAAWSGFKAYGKEHGLKQGKGGYQYFQSSSAADFTPNFDQAATAGYQTIFGVSYQLADAVKQAAKKNPKRISLSLIALTLGLRTSLLQPLKAIKLLILADWPQLTPLKPTK